MGIMNRESTTVDREIFAHKNIRLINFRVVLFSSPQFINDENFPIYGICSVC